MTHRLVPSRRLGIAAGLVAAVLTGSVVAAAAATPPPSPSGQGTAGTPADGADTAETAADKAARTAARDARKAARSARKAAPTGPAFVCDPALSHGQNVSAYARSLPKGPGRGRLVSQAARSDCGKPAGG